MTMADVVKEYSNAVFLLCEEENITDSVLDEIKDLQKIFDANPDYIKLMSAPNIKKEERAALLDSAFSGRINIYLLNFMKIMIERGYFGYIKECFSEFINLYNKKNNIEVITAVTPVALSETQRQKLIDSLSAKLNKKIELIEKIDDSLIGGVRLEMQGKLIDSSIKARLESVRAALNSTVL